MSPSQCKSTAARNARRICFVPDSLRLQREEKDDLLFQRIDVLRVGARVGARLNNSLVGGTVGLLLGLVGGAVLDALDDVDRSDPGLTAGSLPAQLLDSESGLGWEQLSPATTRSNGIFPRINKI